MQQAALDEVGMNSGHARDAIGGLSMPVGVIPECEGALSICGRQLAQRVASLQRIGVGDEDRVDVPRRHGNLGDLGAVDDYQRVLVVAGGVWLHLSGLAGQLVGAVAIGVRDVGDLGLIFEVLGYGHGKEAIALGLFHADVWPDHAIGEDAVRVQVDGEDGAAILKLGEVDLARRCDRRAVMSHGRRGRQQSKNQNRREQFAHGSLQV